MSAPTYPTTVPNSSPFPTPTQRVPTLVVFTLGAAAETKRRQLLSADRFPEESGFHQANLERTLQLGTQAGLRLTIASPTRLPILQTAEHIHQPTGSFGHRLASSIQRACPGDHSPWIVVGTDCPDLDERILEQVCRSLENHPNRVVIGPATDGGVYLVAAAGSLAEALSRVSWGHRRTRRSLLRELAELGREVLQLEPLIDIDTRGDLVNWLATQGSRTTSWVSIAESLRFVLSRSTNLGSSPPLGFEVLFQAAHSGRAPPQRLTV